MLLSLYLSSILSWKSTCLAVLHLFSITLYFHLFSFIGHKPLLIEVKIFRALMGIIDDYFDGYYSEEMIESQVFYTFCLLGFCVFALLE